MNNEHFLKIIDAWKCYWATQTQHSEEDNANYFSRAAGIDSNMRHHLADLLEKDRAVLLGELRTYKHALECLLSDRDKNGCPTTGAELAREALTSIALLRWKI